MHDALAGAHLLAGDLGVDHERATDELQRQVVAQHFLEGVDDPRRILDELCALFGMPPQLIGTRSDDLARFAYRPDKVADSIADLNHTALLEELFGENLSGVVSSTSQPLTDRDLVKVPA